MRRWMWFAMAAVAVFGLGTATLAQTPEQPRIIGPLKKVDRLPGWVSRRPIEASKPGDPVRLTPQVEDLALRATPFTQTLNTVAAAPGSYQQSCRAIIQTEEVDPTSPWRLATLTAECASIRGGFSRTSLNDPDQCNGDIWNDNGVLGCARPPGAFLTSGQVSATPPTNTPPLRGMRLIPQGSYRNTCMDIYIKPGANELRARCRQRNGQWRDASINIAGAACASYSNDDGWLSCDSAPLPAGPWRVMCRSPRSPHPDLGFGAVCPRPEGGMLRSWIGPCTDEVDTLSGYLTCGRVGEDLPLGSYRNACVPTGWSSVGPTLAMTCFTASFIAGDPPVQSHYRVDLSVCGRPFTLFFDPSGTLRCNPKP